MYCLDSDFLIDYLNEDARAAQLYEQIQRSGVRVVTTIITAREVLLGALNRGSQAQYNTAEALFLSLDVLSYDWIEMLATIRLQKELTQKGQSIGTSDEMITGICLAHNLTLVTRNAKHFAKIKGLKTKSW